MVGKGTNPPGWKAFVAGAASYNTLEERIALVKPIIEQVHAIFEELASQPPGSQKLFTALGVGALNNSISSLDPASPQSYRQLLAVNDVLGSGDPRLAVVLLEHNFLVSLLRLHQRVADMSHRLSQAVVALVCTVTLVGGTATAGQLDSLAARPELAELLISHIIYLSIHPSVLLSPSGIGTAQRCIQVCWELTRASSAHCKAFRQLMQRVDAAARLMLIATIGLVRSDGAAAANGGEGEGAASAAAAAEATVAAVAALEEGKDSTAADAAAAGGSDDDADIAAAAAAAAAASGSDMFEERLTLAAQACSLVANLGGLGDSSFNLSTAGLAPLRAWLLRPGTLAALKPLVEGLADGLAELRRRMEAQGPEAELAAAIVADAASAEREDGDLRPGHQPRKRTLAQVEGALRNLLMLLGMPTIVMGTNEADVVEACSFIIRHSFGMFTAGYVDSMRIIRAAASDPPAASSSSETASVAPAFAKPYPGDYASFFRAYAGHVETVVPALGVQLEDWGVRFTGEQAAQDLPVMQVAEGVDARIAQSWLKDQLQDIVNWGHAMMTLVRMSEQAKSPAQPPAQQQQGQGQEQQEAAAGAVAPRTGHCAGCGVAPPAGGPPFQSCSRCRGVRYCSRACQIGHWTQHKAECLARMAAAAAAGTKA